jgi:hypothetical protein
VIFWSFEVLQKVTSRNNLGAGTKKSYSNQVVVTLFVVVPGGDGDKVENSLIPLNVSVILLNVNA